MRMLVNYAVVSWFDPLEGKSREIGGMALQIIGQAPSRRPRLTIPWSHRQRSCGCRDGLQQGTGQQRQTDASLKSHLRPRSGHLHGGGILGDKEIGFHRPAWWVGPPE